MSSSNALASRHDAAPHKSAARADFPIAPPSVANDITAKPPLFSRVELLVIGIGKRDRSTLVEPGTLLARIQRLVFGIEHPAPFADARLEALRSLVVSLRQRRRANAAIAIALAAGVSVQQIAHLEQSR